MRRAVRVVAASGRDAARPLDSVIIKADRRRVQRGEFVGVGGTRFVLDLAEAVALRMGDALELENGGIVEVVIEAEPLIEVRGRDLTHLARLAWHLGDRHLPVQILANRLRLRRNPAIEALLAGLGARLTPIEAPFDPEGGAYASAPADHHHGAHDHGHHHGHHGHDHDTHHDHDHRH
jgi:urease accessory protein